MRKSTVNLEQSKTTIVAKNPKIAKGHAGRHKRQHTYTVIKLTGRLTPKIDEKLSEDEVQELIREQGCTVNITAKK